MSKTKLHGQNYVLQNGNRASSVTTIINAMLGWNKNTLIAWAKRMTAQGEDADAVMREAGRIGTLTHLLIQGFFQGFDVDTRGFKEWYEGAGMKILASELVLVNEELQVGGTVDAIAKKDNELIVVDWKTSKGGPYPEMIVQLGAYTFMYEAAQPKAKVSHGIIMRFGKEDGKFHQHVIDRKKLDAGAQVFKHCCALNKLRSAL
jgi:hypothetical protein